MYTHAPTLYTGNNPPRIAGPTTLLVNLGEVAEIRLNVTDDRNIFNISVIGGLPRNATLSQSDEKSTEFTFKWFSDDIVNISLTFEAKDDFEAISVHNVQVQLCACENSGNCTTDGLLIVTGNTLVLNCECPEGKLLYYSASVWLSVWLLACITGIE